MLRNDFFRSLDDSNISRSPLAVNKAVKGIFKVLIGPKANWKNVLYLSRD